MSARPLTVGVLGGMGPAATADFFSRVVAAEAGLPDQERTRLIIDNNPAVPDRNRARAGEGPSPGPALAAMARGLERAGAELLVMPCNAAHAWRADILAATDLPFVDMIAETVAAARREAPRARQIGVLVADGCLLARLYQAALAEVGIEALMLGPEAQAGFMALLYRIKAGETGAEARGEMAVFAEQLATAGAQAIIAGCTEVPLVLSPDAVSVPLISSTDVLVEAALRRARSVREA